MLIPVEEISADTLFNLVESFVLREGTDYGEQEIGLQQKVEQVIGQLKSKQAFILYSELHETINIISQQELTEMQSGGSEDGEEPYQD